MVVYVCGAVKYEKQLLKKYGTETAEDGHWNYLPHILPTLCHSCHKTESVKALPSML